MAERVSALSIDQKSSTASSSLYKILTESLKIFPRNKHVFFSIILSLAFPLSLLVFSLSLSSLPFKYQILRLEFLATVASTHYEARQVWKESREIFLSLLHIKLLYLIPANFLTLLAAITTVTTADSVYSRKPITLRAVFASVKPTWPRPLITSICMHVILWLYSSLPATLSVIMGRDNTNVRFAIWVIGLGAEIYIMAVMGMSLVVSIVERRSGWDAILVGADLMEGKRTCGWALSGLLAFLTGMIGWKMEELMMDGEDAPVKLTKWAVVSVVEGWERAALVGSYALVVVWGFVVSTVFYREVRKRHVVRDQEDEILGA